MSGIEALNFGKKNNATSGIMLGYGTNDTKDDVQKPKFSIAYNEAQGYLRGTGTIPMTGYDKPTLT